MTLSEARNIMLGIFRDVWGPLGFYVAWPDIPANIPAEPVIWARPSILHSTCGQVSLSGATGSIRWGRSGSLIIQIFAPVGEGLTRLYELAQLVMNAYQRARGSVWFRNIRIKEAGPDGGFNQFNVIVDFDYDDIA